MKTDYKPLPLEDEKSIIAGLKNAGFSEYLSGVIELREYEAFGGDRCIRATLKLETMNVLRRELNSGFEKDMLLQHIGLNIAHGMQLEMSKILPCAAIGDKVIMSRDGYESLRKERATRNIIRLKRY